MQSMRVCMRVDQVGMQRVPPHKVEEHPSRAQRGTVYECRYLYVRSNGEPVSAKIAVVNGNKAVQRSSMRLLNSRT